MIVVITGFKFSHQNRLMKTSVLGFYKKSGSVKPLLRFCKEIEIIFEFEKIHHKTFLLFRRKIFCSGYAKETL
jgi:hypothetical protein